MSSLAAKLRQLVFAAEAELGQARQEGADALLREPLGVLDVERQFGIQVRDHVVQAVAAIGCAAADRGTTRRCSEG